MYKIVDLHTGQQVGRTYKSEGRARTRADNLDLGYGAIRYVVKPVA